MHLPPLTYMRAATPQDAIEALTAVGTAKLLSGGQHILPVLAHDALRQPQTLVDIGRLAALQGIAVQDGILALGAATRLAAVAGRTSGPRLPKLLSRTVGSIANAAIRNRATIGGNIGAGHPQSQLPACLVALGATIETLSPAGTRAIEAAEFFAAPPEEQAPRREMITRVLLPPAREDDWAAYLDVKPRNQDYPVLGLAAAGRRSGEHVDDLRLVYFGSGTPVSAEAAAAALSSRSWNAEVGTAARALLPGAAHWMTQGGVTAAYRAHVAGVLLQRLVAGEGWL